MNKCMFENFRPKHECIGEPQYRAPFEAYLCAFHNDMCKEGEKKAEKNRVYEKNDKFIIVKPSFVNEDDDKVVLGYYDHDGDDYRFIGYLRYGDAHWILTKLNKE